MYVHCGCHLYQLYKLICSKSVMNSPLLMNQYTLYTFLLLAAERVRGELQDEVTQLEQSIQSRYIYVYIGKAISDHFVQNVFNVENTHTKQSYHYIYQITTPVIIHY